MFEDLMGLVRITDRGVGRFSAAGLFSAIFSPGREFSSSSSS